jgi:putative ABC transport system permease protein
LENFNLEVAAVVKDIPNNTHFHFDFLIPYRPQMESRSNVGVYSYFKISSNSTASILQEKLNRLKSPYFGEWKQDAKTTLGIQPITSIHLRSIILMK